MVAEFCVSLGFLIGWYPNVGEYVTVEHIDCGNKQIFVNLETNKYIDIVDYLPKDNVYVIKDK